MDLKTGNYRGYDALHYRCTGHCAVAARQIGRYLGTLADFTPVVGDVKGAYEFTQDPTLLGGVAVVVGLVPGIGDAAGKGIKALESPAARKAAEGIKQFLGKSDPTVISRKGGNMNIVSADEKRQVRLEFTESSGKQIKPHAYIEQRNKKGDWEPVAADHIFFEGRK